MVIDGIAYKDMDVESKPDLGSWKCAKREKSDITGKEVREYYGLSDDIDKLPTGNTNDKYKKVLASGSVAVCTDTGEVLVYEETAMTWTVM